MKNPLVTGLALQALAILVILLSLRFLYSASWLPILLVGIPSLLVSPVFLMKTPLSLPARVALSWWFLIIPGYVCASNVFAWTVTWAYSRREIILIPESFHGKAVITYEDPAGALPVRDGKAAIFRVGPDGKLRTQDEGRVDNWDLREFYYVAADGSTRKLERSSLPDGDPGVQAVIFGGGEAYQDARIGKRALSLEFYVGTRQQIREALDESLRR